MNRDEVWGDTDGDRENNETGTEVEDIKVIIFPVVGGVKQGLCNSRMPMVTTYSTFYLQANMTEQNHL